MSARHGAPIDAAGVLVAKGLVASLTLALGFHALSDDDFARVVIAQRWAEAPSLDPSGTSWLPLPFWLSGAAHGVFGMSFDVARSTAIQLGALGALLVWRAALLCTESRAAALVGALIAVVFPYSAWLSVATVPEGWTAALGVYALATQVPRASLGERVAGAFALMAATLSRYEAWSLVPVFAALSLLRARREGARELWPVALALLGPLAWLVHGALHHGSATFFVARVAAYRRALGDDATPLALRLLRQPWAVIRAEPELVSATIVVVLGAARAARSLSWARWRPLGLGALALLAFLTVGDLRDGAPTHHGERAVLLIWLGAALLLGDAAVSLVGASRGARLVTGALALAACVIATTVVRPWYARRDAFVDRRAELAAGAAARAAVGPTARLAVDADDFGFFATIAGWGAPSRAVALDDRDPRAPRPADPWASATALRERAQALGATHVVALPRHAATASHAGRVVAAAARFSVVELGPR